jgi:multidrug efflux pump subunit AcrA (membrane-fusion protein)
MRKILWGVVIVAAVAAGVMGVWHAARMSSLVAIINPDHQVQRAAWAVPVKVALARYDTVSVTVDAIGTLRANRCA